MPDRSLTILSAKNWVCQDVPRGREFVAFNCDRLTTEPICDADIVPTRVAKNSQEASATWSANCSWYFVVTAAGIILGRPGKEDALLCVKKSWCFLEAFIEARWPNIKFLLKERRKNR